MEKQTEIQTDPDRFRIIVNLHPEGKYLGRYYCLNEEWEYKAGEDTKLNRCDLFMELIEKLETVKTKHNGFWFNRDLIMARLQYIYIYYDCEKKEILGFFWAEDKEDHIKVQLIETFPRGAGNGKIMIEYLKNNGKDILASDCLRASHSFWEKMGFEAQISNKVTNYYWKRDRNKIPDLDIGKEGVCLIYGGAWIPLSNKVEVDKAMEKWKLKNKKL